MNEVKSVAVIGAGTMGSGIAYTAAVHGVRVYQLDVAPEQVDRARSYHEKTFQRSVGKERLTDDEAREASQLISYHTDLGEAADAEWVIEAVIEDASVKQKLFWQMLEIFGSDTVLATNTSSISITRIASVVEDQACRVVGMHFFNPVPVMKLVEVVPGLATSEETTQRTIDFARQLGKVPVPANDRAGFVSNRVLMPMINEAFHAWMEGVAQPEHIDEIMKLGCNFPMGPLRLADFIGLDVCHDIMMVLFNELGEDKYFPCPKLRQLVVAGRLGDKTGRGVFEYA